MRHMRPIGPISPISRSSLPNTHQLRVPVSLILVVLHVTRRAIRPVCGNNLTARARVGLAVMTFCAGRSWRSQVNGIASCVTARATQLAILVP